MDMSHLYHDSAFGDPSLQLDVKEQIRTRESNAREERNLERLSRSFERAKGILEKTNSWEKWKVGQSLHSLWERTPRLEKSLAVEKARVASLQKALLARGLHCTGDDDGQGDTTQVKETPRSVSPVPETTETRNHDTGHHRDRLHGGNHHRNRKRGDHRDRRKHRKKEDNSSDQISLNTNVGILERQIQKPADFVKRSEHVVKALAKLNWRQESRRKDHLRFKEELEEFSKPIIDKARVILKGRNDIDVDQLFDDLEHFFASDRDGSKVSGSLDTLLLDTRSSDHGGSQPSLLTEGNLVQLQTESGGYRESFLPSIVASTSQVDLTTINNNGDDTTDFETNHHHSNNNNNEGPGGSDEAMPPINADNQLLPMHEIDNISKIEKSEEISSEGRSFHLPLIQSRLSDNGITGHMAVVSSKDFESSKSRALSSNDSQHRNLQNDTGSKGSMGEKDVFSSPPTVPLTVCKKNEGMKYPEGGTGSDPVFRNFPIFSNDGLDDCDTNEGKDYTLPCTTGLPQLWKQAPKQQKDKPVQEVSPAAIARKHRRRRLTNQSGW